MGSESGLPKRLQKAILEYQKTLNRLFELLSKHAGEIEDSIFDFASVFEEFAEGFEDARTTLIKELLSSPQLKGNYTHLELLGELGLSATLEELGIPILDSELDFREEDLEEMKQFLREVTEAALEYYKRFDEEIAELVRRIAELLVAERDLEIYAPLDSASSMALVGIPLGASLGKSVIVSKNDLPKAILNFIHHSGAGKGLPEWTQVALESLELDKTEKWIRKSLGIAGHEKALTVGRAAISQDFDILRFLTAGRLVELLPRILPLYITYSPSNPSDLRFHLKLPAGSYWGSHDEKLERITKLNELSESTDEIAERLRVTLAYIGLSTTLVEVPIRFALLIFALEGLLLERTPYQLAVHLSQRAAILLEESSEKRLKAYKTFKKYYQKRSRIAHGGSTDRITIDDYWTLLRQCRKIFWKVYILYKEEKIVTLKGLVDWIEDSLFYDDEEAD